MDLASINTQMASAVANASGVSALTGAAGGLASSAAGGTGGGFDFAATLNSALQSVSQSPAQATELQKQFQLENPNVSLEQTMVAMNTSALSFSAAVQVRNRVVQAYDTIMNMQI
jgi:flagellar hook-basal body complex protein FliE